MAADFVLRLKSRELLVRVALIVFSVEALLVLLDIVFSYNKLIPVGSIQRLFNMAREDSLGAWLGTAQVLIVGQILWLIFLRTRSRAWALIAAFFTYLAIDDGSKLHERLGTAFKYLGQPSATEAVDPALMFPSYTWQLVLGPFFVSMGIFILVFLWREFNDKNLKWWIFAALSLYGCAVGLDFVEGLKTGSGLKSAYDDIAVYLGVEGKLINHFGRVFEETLELMGSSVFLLSFLRHFMDIAPRTTVEFKDA